MNFLKLSTIATLTAYTTCALMPQTALAQRLHYVQKEQKRFDSAFKRLERNGAKHFIEVYKNELSQSEIAYISDTLLNLNDQIPSVKSNLHTFHVAYRDEKPSTLEVVNAEEGIFKINKKFFQIDHTLSFNENVDIILQHYVMSIDQYAYTSKAQSSQFSRALSFLFPTAQAEDAEDSESPETLNASEDEAEEQINEHAADEANPVEDDTSEAANNEEDSGLPEDSPVADITDDENNTPRLPASPTETSGHGHTPANNVEGSPPPKPVQDKSLGSKWSNLSTGAKLAIAVGTALVIGLIAFLIYRNAQKKRMAELKKERDEYKKQAEAARKVASESSSSSSGSSHSPTQSGGSIDGPGGFLWKPVSESNGKLVVLTPKDTRNQFENLGIYNCAGGSDCTLVEQGTFVGDTHNGNRPHFRFSQPGSAYQDATVKMNFKDGQTQSWHIPDGSKRFD